MTARDVIFIAVAITTLALAFFIMHYSYGTIADIMINHSAINESTQAVEAIEKGKEITNRFDYIIFVVFMALAFALIVTGWLIGGNAIFMFIYFIAIVIAIILAAVLNNVWIRFSEMTVFSAVNTVGQFPLTDALLSNFPLYIGLVGFLGLIIMFAKSSSVGDGR